MRLTKLLILVLLLCSLMACSSEDNSEDSQDNHTHHMHHSHEHNTTKVNRTTPITYNQYGITLTIPTGWTEIETVIPEAGRYLSVEKVGDDASGQFIVSIIDNEIALDNYMKVMQEQIKNRISLPGVEVKFTETQAIEFNGAKALTCGFSHNSGGLDFRGKLKLFHCGAKTVYVFIQEEAEDLEENKIGLELLERSLACS